MMPKKIIELCITLVDVALPLRAQGVKLDGIGIYNVGIAAISVSRCSVASATTHAQTMLQS